MAELGVLDNPIWSSLTTAHRSIARLSGSAARYAAEVSPFAAFENPTAAAFVDLSALVALEEGVAFCLPAPLETPPDWKVGRAFPLEQMVCSTNRGLAAVPRPLELGPNDVPAMLALTAATEPGPFHAGTIQMGRYFGVKTETGQLVAMAGERMKPAGFTEISAVCTDPEFRGHGHARALVSFLIALIFSEARTPILHVKGDNAAAVALYRALGFESRREMHLTVIARV